MGWSYKERILSVLFAYVYRPEIHYKYVILDQNIVELSDISSKNGPQKDELGGSIDRVYKFKALKEGKTKIVFTTEYFGDKNSIYEYVEYNVNIDKNLNMIII